MKYNRKINKYLKVAESVCNKCYQFEYEEIRKYIKEQYTKDEKFNSMQNIKLEIERITNNIESSKFPYLSMLLGISSPCIGIMINNVLIDNLRIYTQLLRYPIIAAYIIGVVSVFEVYFSNLERKYKCYYVAKSILEEMLQQEEEKREKQTKYLFLKL